MKATITGTNRHHLFITDPGKRNLREIAPDGTFEKELNIQVLAYDAWKLSDGTYEYCFISPTEDPHGVIHCDAEGKIITEYRTKAQLFGCQPLENSRILAGELDYSRLIELEPDGTISKIIPIQTKKICHNTMRMCRKTADGTYLVNQPEDCVIRRYDENGNILSEITTPGDTFGVVPDGKGNIYFTAKTELFLKREKDDTLIWHVSKEELKEINPCWLTGMELLQNGNLLVVNWLGHGMAGSGAPIFEITPSKEIVWTLRAPEFTEAIAHIQCLDEDIDTLIEKTLR